MKTFDVLIVLYIWYSMMKNIDQEFVMEVDFVDYLVVKLLKNYKVVDRMMVV